jgi:hypothetical protein
VRQGKNVRITATTGIASTMFPDATTLHSIFGLMDGRFRTEYYGKNNIIQYNTIQYILFQLRSLKGQ